MKKVKSTFDHHVFICTNKKTGKPCCADRDAEKIRNDLKNWSKSDPSWSGRIRINASGCLDRCSEGVAMVVYPENEWFVNINESNLDEIKKTIAEIMNRKNHATGSN